MKRTFVVGLALTALIGNAQSELKPKQGLKPFEYIEAPDALPNYRAGAQWGTQDEPIRTMQKPLSAEESLQHLVVPEGFTVSLFASEPEVVKAIWMDWDERGRLWIASTVDYPNDMRPLGQGNDRLMIVEDTNGDGKADSFKTFAEKLSVPTGFTFANGGVIVVHSGKTEFLQDTDGDDKADVRRDLFVGWGTNDTHAGPSNLRYGFDNWIWGTVGYSGFRGTVGGKELRFGQGIFRFKPDGSALEFIRSSNNNTWGLGFTEDNIVIGSTANGNASMYLPIPNRYYEGVNGFSASVLGTIADSQNIYPITKKVRQVDYHGKFTAGAGSAIYTARAFPKEYWNTAQFVTEPTGHLIAKLNLVRRGSDFAALNVGNFAASDDEWTSPVCAEVGPDGALWVSDWYNYIIQHNPTPRGFENGKGNAYVTNLRDKKHGRIYRIAHSGAKASGLKALNAKKPAELVAALKSDNMFWRLTAQRMLVARGNKDVAPQLAKLVADKSVDEIGLNVGAAHALWTLHGLGVTEHAKAGLDHKSAAVRRAAVMTSAKDDGAKFTGLLKDSDAQVRLAAMLAISEAPASAQAAKAVAAAMQDSANHGDRWIADALIAAAAKNDAAFLREVLAAGKALNESQVRVAKTVSTHYGQRAPADSIVATLGALSGASAEVAGPILDGVVAGWPREKAPKFSDSDKAKLLPMMDKMAEPVRDRLLALSRRWEQPAIFGPKVAGIMDNLKAEVSDASGSDEKRIAAARRLVGIDDSRESAKIILANVSALSTPALVNGLLAALSESRDQNISQELFAVWNKFTPAARRNAVQMLLRRPEWTRDLLEAVDSGKISRGDIAVEQWAQMRNSRDRGMARRAERLMSAGASVSADRQEIVNKLLPLAKAKGDPARGKEVYTANCAVCHVFNGAGGKVGPDLTGIGAKDRAEILTDILDPNRSVEANYRMWNVTTKDGETFSGRLDAETQTTVEILDTTGNKHAIQRKDIATMEGLATSIMPAGFEALPEADISALMEYLGTPH